MIFRYIQRIPNLRFIPSNKKGLVAKIPSLVLKVKPSSNSNSYCSGDYLDQGHADPSHLEPSTDQRQYSD